MVNKGDTFFDSKGVWLFMLFQNTTSEIIKLVIFQILSAGNDCLSPLEVVILQAETTFHKACLVFLNDFAQFNSHMEYVNSSIHNL